MQRPRAGRGHHTYAVVPQPSSTENHCPEVVMEGDQIRIGEDANTAVLRKEEWNIPVDLIQSGQ